MKNVAVVGASGAVGEVMTRLPEERDFPVGSIRFLASERSGGRLATFRGTSYPIEPLKPKAFDRVELALMSVPAGVSKEYGPIAASVGAAVVDKSSVWRMDPTVPLIVPEVNRAILTGTGGSSPTRTAPPSRWSSRSNRWTAPSASAGSSPPPTNRSPGRGVADCRPRLGRRR